MYLKKEIVGNTRAYMYLSDSKLQPINKIQQKLWPYPDINMEGNSRMETKFLQVVAFTRAIYACTRRGRLVAASNATASISIDQLLAILLCKGMVLYCLKSSHTLRNPLTIESRSVLTFQRYAIMFACTTIMPEKMKKLAYSFRLHDSSNCPLKWPQYGDYM